MIVALISAYGMIALTHLLIQMNIAHAEYLKTLHDSFNPNYTPSVSIIIPSYNEDEEALYDSVESCLNQQYKGRMDVLVVNDGSTRPEGFFRVRERLQHHPRVWFIHYSQNQGKRHAQKKGFDIKHRMTEAIVTIDSDTILAPTAVSYIVQKLQDPSVGAVTGHVKVIKTKKLLSKLISARYWSAFNQERAAQSFFGTVLCCSGPLAAYRSSILGDIKDKYITQEFLGDLCTYGDDRHLTNLVLEQGYKVHYDRRAVAYTHVPQSIPGYLRQQTRWNKSFYREMLWTARMVIRDPLKLHPYIVYDLTAQFILPFLLMVSLAYTFYKTMYVSPYALLAYLATLMGIAMIRSLYALYRTRDMSLLIFPIYAFIHVFLLIPVRLYAIMTLRSVHWGTR